MALTFPVIVGDIGGTNSRFRMIGHDGSVHGQTLSARNAEYESVAEALRSLFEPELLHAAQSLILAIASPIDQPPFSLTNADWQIDPDRIMSDLGLQEIRVMNDFLAQGLACATLPLEGMEQVGGLQRDETAPRVVIGPGTGLGVAQLVHAGGRWIIIPGEGGHIECGPRTVREFKLWPYLEKRGGRLETEMAVSGQGLENLYRGLKKLEKRPDRDVPASAVWITESALADNALACEAVTLFSTVLARFAGDLALLSLARGGVYLTGGVTPHVMEQIRSKAFRAAFEDKQPYAHIMADIPIYVMPTDHPALDGIASYASDPPAFHTGQGIQVFK